MSATFSGNGSFDSSKYHRYYQYYTTNGTALISLMTHISSSKGDHYELNRARLHTATFYEIAKFNPATTGEGKGLCDYSD